MASDDNPNSHEHRAGRTHKAGPDSGPRGAEAARHRSPHPSAPPGRSPRPRVEVHVNEFTGTMSWRTLGRQAPQPAPASGQYGTSPGAPHRRTLADAPWSARAAALRSAGLDPSRAPAKGAAPIPTHPAAVRAALSVDVASLGPEQLRRHLARIGTLRSRVAADLIHGSRMPTAVASRLRSTTATPAHAHALTAERAATATRPPAPTTRPGPAATHRR